jgi:UDP-glucose 4-epimerase
MVRRLLAGGVAEVRILSRDEFKQDDMRRQLNDDRARFYIGDVRDYDSVHRASRGVDFAFHAAALKQVPSCEFFPIEAVRTNVLGSANVVEACNANEVRSLVCLGTDKAAYPINAMGLSKALMEKVAQAFARNNPTAATTVSTVRYGNVMLSRGSVIPLFVEQALAGQPMTVTDPSMTRFLMSLDEAVGLVEHAFRLACPGDLFIRKAAACTIETLALAVARLVGAEPRVCVIGTRHGEKLYETLATREELRRAEDQGGYFRVCVDARDLNYGEYFEEGDPSSGAHEDFHSHNTRQLDLDEVVNVLRNLPAFTSMLERA